MAPLESGARLGGKPALSEVAAPVGTLGRTCVPQSTGLFSGTRGRFPAPTRGGLSVQRNGPGRAAPLCKLDHLPTLSRSAAVVQWSREWRAEDKHLRFLMIASSWGRQRGEAGLRGRGRGTTMGTVCQDKSWRSSRGSWASLGREPSGRANTAVTALSYSALEGRQGQQWGR